MPLLNLTDSDFEALLVMLRNTPESKMLRVAIVPMDDQAALAGALRSAGVHDSQIAKLVPDAPVGGWKLEATDGRP